MLAGELPARCRDRLSGFGAGGFRSGGIAPGKTEFVGSSAWQPASRVSMMKYFMRSFHQPLARVGGFPS